MLPQMTGRQRYRANALIKRLCANYDGGNCLLLDDGEPCVCVQSISYFLLCKYFRNAVLPAEPKLEAEILMSGAKTVCERCGVPIEKHSNRQKYCPECARIMYLKNKAKYQRNKRSGVDNQTVENPYFKPFLYEKVKGLRCLYLFPLFCVLIFHEGRFIIWLILKQEMRSKVR